MRTFLAIELPAEIRREIKEVQEGIRDSQRVTSNAIKWVKEENIHLTLKFLGELSEGKAEDLKRGVEETALNSAPFTISLQDTGAFPNWNRAKVIWVAVSNGKEELIQLQRGIEGSLVRYHFREEERPFSPHITIGRVKKGRRALESPQVTSITDESPMAADVHFSTEDFLIDKVSVMKSTLTSSGPIYERIGAIPLGRGGSIR